MSGKRTLFLDASPGERRGAVLLDGQPERLFLERAGDPPSLETGMRGLARVRRVEAGLGIAFLELDGGGEAILSFAGGGRPVEGAEIPVEVAAPARAGKAAVARIAPAGDAPAALSLEDRLRAAAPTARIDSGPDARQAADLAEEAVLAVEHPLPGGASLAIEPTRALVAVDVDLGGASGADPRRGSLKINLLAVAATARLLRLKGLGGLVVIDLAGRGHDGKTLAVAVRVAFEPDMPGVSIGPISRFGALELAAPWRRRPLSEILLAADGRLSARTVAFRLARALEREGRADPGARLSAVCSPEVAAELRPLLTLMGPRFDVREGLDFDRLRTDIQAHG